MVRMQTESVSTWEKAVVQRRLDEFSYEVDTPEGTYRRNRVLLRRTLETETSVPHVSVLPHNYQRYAAVPVATTNTTRNETVINPEPVIIRRSTRQTRRLRAKVNILSSTKVVVHRTM